MAQLFDYVLVIIYTKSKGPVISYKFPKFTDNKNDEIANAAPLFCFPEEGSSIKIGKETFSFTLTTGTGGKKFGYCRRFNAFTSDPESYCIVSQCSSFSLFSVILDIVEERRKANSSAVFSFLKSVLAYNLPNPGEKFTVTTFSSSGASEPDKYELSVPLHNEFLLDYVSFQRLFRILSIKDIITLFECLLIECRVIFVSKKLSILSECVNAATAMLNPFTWQYVFIPILPSSLLTYCCAPMPFIVGITTNSLPELSKLPMEEVVMIDLDKGGITQIPNHSKCLDKETKEYLKSSLHRIKSACKGGDKTFDLNIAKCFLSVLVRLCGTYSSFLKPTGFNTENFLEFVPPQFYSSCKIITESQMWSCFIHERENLLKNNNLQSCILLKEFKTPWDPTNLSVQCTKCNAFITVNAKVNKGKIYCDTCYKSKQTDSFSFGTLRKLKNMMKRNSSQIGDDSEITKTDSKRDLFVRQLSGPIIRSNTLQSNSKPFGNNNPFLKESNLSNSAPNIPRNSTNFRSNTISNRGTRANRRNRGSGGRGRGNRRGTVRGRGGERGTGINRGSVVNGGNSNTTRGSLRGNNSIKRGTNAHSASRVKLPQ